MQHNIHHIRSLQACVIQQASQKLPYDKILNRWMEENGILVQDADTIDYYLTLIPIMERRMEHNEKL